MYTPESAPVSHITAYMAREQDTLDQQNPTSNDTAPFTLDGASRVQCDNGLVVYLFHEHEGVYVLAEDLADVCGAEHDFLNRLIRDKVKHGLLGHTLPSGEPSVLCVESTVRPTDDGRVATRRRYFVNTDAVREHFSAYDAINAFLAYIDEVRAGYKIVRASASQPAPQDPAQPSAPASLRPVAIGDVLVGRHADNGNRQATVIDTDGISAQLRHDTGRTTWISASTIYDRYSLRDDPSARLTVGTENPIDQRVRTPRAPKVSTHAQPHSEPANETQSASTDADPSKADVPLVEPDDVEPTDTVTKGVELAIINGWSIYTHDNTREPTVRDLDIAKRAGLANPRDIRTTIKALIGTGELDEIPEGTTIVGGDDDGISPRAYVVKVPTPIGSDTTRLVPEFHLNEAGVAVLAMHLRTEKAAMMRRSIAQTFVLVRQGRLEEAARVATGQSPTPTVDLLQRQLDAIERLKADGVIDSRTASVQFALAVSKATGMDLITPPNVTFGKWSPAAEAINDLEPGESVVFTKMVDVEGHYSAKRLGQEHSPPVSPCDVGDLARKVGVFGVDRFGKWTPISNNGIPIQKDGATQRAWNYNEAARSALFPALAEFSAWLAGKKKSDKHWPMIEKIGAKHQVDTSTSGTAAE